MVFFDISFMKEVHISEFDILKDKKGFIESLFHDGNLDVSFHYPSDFQKTQLLRDIVDMIWEIVELDNKWRRRIVLIVDELNNNAIEYGSTQWDINKMRLILSTSESISIKIEVEDSGKWNKSQNADNMRKLQDQKIKQWFNDYSSIRWRGLFMIILNLVDSLYFKDASSGWLVVWVEKKFS